MVSICSVGAGRSRRAALRQFSTVALRGFVVTIALAVGLLLLVERLLPSASALTLPVRVVDRTARLTAEGPAPDRYPYSTGARPLALDANGFVVGECTSFAAWWLNAHHFPLAVLTVGPGGTGSFLNASTWDTAARSAGFRSGQLPVVGAVAQWHDDERSVSRNPGGREWTFVAGKSGHVAVVTAVLPDGQAEWVEYGWKGRPVLHRGRGWAPRYLYLGVPAPAGPQRAVPR